MYKIVSDSACDLSKEYLEKHDVTIVPLSVSFDGETYYRDGVDITRDECYQKMIDNPKLFPKTSLPSVESYAEVFRKYVEQGLPVVCFTITTLFSGSYNSAMNAKSLVEEELEKEGFAKESIDTYLGLFKEITSDIEGVRYCKEKLKDVLDPKVAEDLETIISTVDSVKTADFKMSFDPTLVRGMSYYTGPIFEISMDEFGGSVGGGGRYDEMIGKFTGNNTSACGFSIGFERIVMLLLERNYEIPTKNGKKAYLIEKNMPADKMLTILKQAQEERNAGTQINISIMKKNKKFQKDQMTAEGYTEFVEFFKDRM